MKPPLNLDDADLSARRFAALGNPARIAILQHLALRDACCCKDVVERLDLAQSTVSQHLKILVEAGLVVYAPDRPRSRYTLDREAVTQVRRSLEGLIPSCATE